MNRSLPGGERGKVYRQERTTAPQNFCALGECGHSWSAAWLVVAGTQGRAWSEEGEMDIWAGVSS